jgi:hypothetical protein
VTCNSEKPKLVAEIRRKKCIVEVEIRTDGGKNREQKAEREP